MPSSSTFFRQFNVCLFQSEHKFSDVIIDIFTNILFPSKTFKPLFAQSTDPSDKSVCLVKQLTYYCKVLANHHITVTTVLFNIFHCVSLTDNSTTCLL